MRLLVYRLAIWWSNFTNKLVFHRIVRANINAPSLQIGHMMEQFHKLLGFQRIMRLINLQLPLHLRNTWFICSFPAVCLYSEIQFPRCPPGEIHEQLRRPFFNLRPGCTFFGKTPPKFVCGCIVTQYYKCFFFFNSWGVRSCWKYTNCLKQRDLYTARRYMY